MEASPSPASQEATPRQVAEAEAADLTLRVVAERAATALDRFNNWLVLGLAASLSLLVANLDGLLKVVATGNVKQAMGFLLAALGVGVFTKLFSTLLLARMVEWPPELERLRATPQFDRELYNAEVDRGFGSVAGLLRKARRRRGLVSIGRSRMRAVALVNGLLSTEAGLTAAAASSILRGLI
jgi:hypothetical protein